jgi:hypothetical protein
MRHTKKILSGVALMFDRVVIFVLIVTLGMHALIQGLLHK